MTPEEAALMLAALGFKRDTRIYLAGAEFFGGHSRTITLVSLYPNLVTKEDLISKRNRALHQKLFPGIKRVTYFVCLVYTYI